MSHRTTKPSRRAPRTTTVTEPVRLLKPLGHRLAAARRDAIEAAAVHAAYAATAGGFTHPRYGATVRGWQPSPDGGVQQHLADGTLLHHPGAFDAPFTAPIPCAAGGTHLAPVATAPDLIAAQRSARQCSRPHTDILHLTRDITPVARFRAGFGYGVLTLQQAKGQTSA